MFSSGSSFTGGSFANLTIHLYLLIIISCPVLWRWSWTDKLLYVHPQPWNYYWWWISCPGLAQALIFCFSGKTETYKVCIWAMQGSVFYCSLIIVGDSLLQDAESSIISDSSGDCLPISCLILLFLIYFSQFSIQPSSLLNHHLSHPQSIPPLLLTSSHPSVFPHPPEPTSV